MVGIALVILLLAGSLASFFTSRRARNLGKNMWSPSSRKMAFHLLVPLAAGGIFCILMAYHGYGRMVSSVPQVFYGLALINAGKFTFHEIRYLGYTEILLGLLTAFLLDYGILMWAIGFGFLHIFYGILMYVKYGRKA